MYIQYFILFLCVNSQTIIKWTDKNDAAVLHTWCPIESCSIYELFNTDFYVIKNECTENINLNYKKIYIHDAEIQDGETLTDMIVRIYRNCNVTAILIFSHKEIPGSDSYVYDSDINEDIPIFPVIDVSQSGEILFNNITTNDIIRFDVTVNNLNYNNWENIYESYGMMGAHALWIIFPGIGLIHGCIRFIQALIRNIITCRLRSLSPVKITLIAIIIGNLFKFIFALIDPLSYQLIIPSRFAGFIGVFSVPFSELIFVAVSCNWLYILTLKMKKNKKRLNKYRIIGYTLSGVVILLALFSGICNILKIHSFNIVSTAYFMIYIVTQFFLSILTGILSIMVYKKINKNIKLIPELEKKHKQRRINVMIYKMAIMLFCSFLVGITFLLFAFPMVYGNPEGYVIDATFISFSLMLLSISQVEMFDYSDKKFIPSTKTTNTKNSNKFTIEIKTINSIDNDINNSTL
uniref:Uncharacterized protein n=1 Tax=Pithovirus LCPAC102 TaxID=2506587 RepID=A0A481Z571_9VIRU|nr:MAG: hypothetical protein LCPAC102_00590 [Pithovirus LCPAC102]